MQNVDSLYGIKIGDKVQYIGNNEEQYNPILFDKIGIVDRIVSETGEFHVKIGDFHYDTSFQRHDILFLDDPEIADIKVSDFEGLLVETESMSVSEIRGYLTKYHDFVEGRNFSVSTRDGVNEVMLGNDEFASLIKDLITIQKVNREMAESHINDFKHTLKPTIQYGSAISVSFKASNWTFRTHLTPWMIQHSLLLNYDINLYEEWGFKI